MVSVSEHVGGCAECQREFERLCAEMPAPELDIRHLASLREHMRKWEQRNETPAARAELRRKLVLELAPFVGDAAVGRLLRAVPEDSLNLLSTLEPVLTRFLSISAASELVKHLVESVFY
jgi:hypothetical protein